MAAPAKKIEIEFTAGVWTDVGAYARLTTPITMTFGRSDVDDRVQPGRLSGLVLRNNDSRFTVGNGSSPYSPNVVPGKRIRVSVQDPVSLAWVIRWTGYVDGWPLEWQAGNCTVTVSATDALSTLQVDVPPGEWLEYAHQSAEYYWPFTDNLVDLSHAPVIGARSMIAGTAATAPTETGPPGDPSLLPVTLGVTGSMWEQEVVPLAAPLSGTSHTAWTATCLFKGSTAEGTPLWVRNSTSSQYVTLTTTADGYLRVGLGGLGGLTLYGTGTVNICDGNWWWLSLSGGLEDDWQVVAVAWRIDESAYTTATVSGIFSTEAMFATDIRLRVGEFPATIGHVGWWYDSAVNTGYGDYYDKLRAFSGLPWQSLYEFGLLYAALYPDTPVAKVEVGRSYLHNRPLPATLSDLWAQVEAVDGGVTHAMPDGTVRYLSGAYKNVPLSGTSDPAVDLDATTVASLRVELDRLKIVNDVTVTTKQSGPSGDATVEKVTSTDSTSIAKSGRRPKAHECYGSRYSGGAATIAAELMSPRIDEVTAGIYTLPRIPEVEVNALTLPAATQSQILTGGYAGGPVNMWDLIAVTDMPTAGAFPDWLGRIEGWTETLGATEWRIKFNTTYSGAVYDVPDTGLFPGADVYPATDLYPEA